MGDKVTARNTANEAGVLGVPGSPGVLKDIHEVTAFAKKVGFPILLKASAGGGGKGMRRVDREEDLASAFEGASREALNSLLNKIDCKSITTENTRALLQHNHSKSAKA
jgi:acetyl-CoA carboxylase biotin carboxylase subunit